MFTALELNVEYHHCPKTILIRTPRSRRGWQASRQMSVTRKLITFDWRGGPGHRSACTESEYLGRGPQEPAFITKIPMVVLMYTEILELLT